MSAAIRAQLVFLQPQDRVLVQAIGMLVVDYKIEILAQFVPITDVKRG
jgi:hypothetical protein